MKKTSTITPFYIVGIGTEIGIKIALPLLLFVFLGVKVDKSIGTLPLFTILGILLALGCSVYLIWRMIKRIEAKDNRN